MLVKNFTSTEAKTRFGDFMDAGMKEGACITRNGRPAGYFVPAEKYIQQQPVTGVPLAAPSGISEILAQYSIGLIPRLAAMKKIGTDDYGVLLRLLNAAGFPHPQSKGADVAKMSGALASVLRSSA